MPSPTDLFITYRSVCMYYVRGRGYFACTTGVCVCVDSFNGRATKSGVVLYKFVRALPHRTHMCVNMNMNIEHSLKWKILYDSLCLFLVVLFIPSLTGAIHRIDTHIHTHKLTLTQRRTTVSEEGREKERERVT